MLGKYIDQLVIDLEIEEKVSTDIEDVYAMQLDQSISVTIKDLKPGFILETKVAKIPKDTCEELLCTVMAGNFLGQGTVGEAVLGLDNQGKVLTLTQFFPYESDYNEFKDCLEDFVNCAASWQTIVEELTKK